MIFYAGDRRTAGHFPDFRLEKVSLEKKIPISTGSGSASPASSLVEAGPPIRVPQSPIIELIRDHLTPVCFSRISFVLTIASAAAWGSYWKWWPEVSKVSPSRSKE